MTNQPSRFIVSKSSQEYLEQGRTHCGVFTAKGVLSAYGLDVHEDPRDYHRSKLGRSIGAILPSGLVRILRKHGIESVLKKTGDLSPKEKIGLLKQAVARDVPVPIAIANGYSWKRRSYSQLQAVHRKHFITVLGYDDDPSEFYVYDSVVPMEHHDSTVPIGNTRKSYEEMLRDWRSHVLMRSRGAAYIALSR